MPSTHLRLRTKGAAILTFAVVNDLIGLVRKSATRGVPAARTDTGIRTELGERAIEASVARPMSYRIISLQKRGLVPNCKASMCWMFTSEVAQRVAQTGMKVLGRCGNLFRGDRRAPLQVRIAYASLDAARATIAGDTSEIQRNISATRGLDLPRR